MYKTLHMASETGRLRVIAARLAPMYPENDRHEGDVREARSRSVSVRDKRNGKAPRRLSRYE